MIENFIFSQNIFFAALSMFALGAMGSLIFRKNDELANKLGNWFAISGSFLGILFGAAILVTGQTFSSNTASVFPILSLSFGFDFLSVFFLTVISLVALACSIYALGYVKHYYGKYSIGVLGFFYNAFIAGMLMVVTAHNLLFFLIVWEIMSLASYFLVIYEHRQDENVKAGYLYFVMTHAGTAFIIFAFLILYKATGSFDFETIKSNISGISPLFQNLIFISALFGFGTKAGIIPLHIWLPSAHPAAPSHVSALMSGVMIKTGIYMFIRLFFDILPNTPIWWGLTFLILGSISSLLGVLYALSEHDLKKLLAYHSIENIGIIFLGLGSSLIFLSLNMKTLAVLGLIAALYHTINHAVFKALLFLGAGAVISKTHTRNIEEYGGLIKLMPATALFFLIGSMAISALPPFNGFFSEWLTFQSLFSGIGAFGIFTKIIFTLAIGSLAFTGGLALACFVKAFGATFLGRPRSDEAKHAKESALSLQVGMAILGVSIVFLGLFASGAVQIFSRIAGSLGNLAGFDPNISYHWTKITVQNFSSLSMPVIFLGIVAAIAATIGIVYFFTRKRKITTGITWNCGTPATSRMEITATGFSRSIVSVFRGLLRPTAQTEIEFHDAKFRYFPKTSTFKAETEDIYRLFFYEPLHKLITKISEEARKIQSGNINMYILYIFLTLISLLALINY